MDIPADWIQRFNDKWKENGKTGCWEWVAALSGKGYGQIKIPRTRRQIQSHRLSFLIHRGDIPRGRCVLHRCDNRVCVNPEHLFLGSKLDNARDMVSKNRHCFGEKQGASKLTETEVKAALAMIASGVPQIRVAELLNISPMQISRIKRGERWGHIQPDKPKWRKRRKFLTETQVNDVLKRLKDGESQHSIADSIGISQSHVSRIARGLVKKAGLLRRKELRPGETSGR